MKKFNERKRLSNYAHNAINYPNYGYDSIPSFPKKIQEDIDYIFKFAQSGFHSYKGTFSRADISLNQILRGKIEEMIGKSSHRVQGGTKIQLSEGIIDAVVANEHQRSDGKTRDNKTIDWLEKLQYKSVVEVEDDFRKNFLLPIMNEALQNLVYDIQANTKKEALVTERFYRAPEPGEKGGEGRGKNRKIKCGEGDHRRVYKWDFKKQTKLGEAMGRIAKLGIGSQKASIEHVNNLTQRKLSSATEKFANRNYKHLGGVTTGVATSIAAVMNGDKIDSIIKEWTGFEASLGDIDLPSIHDIILELPEEVQVKITEYTAMLPDVVTWGNIATTIAGIIGIVSLMRYITVKTNPLSPKNKKGLLKYLGKILLGSLTALSVLIGVDRIPEFIEWTSDRVPDFIDWVSSKFS